MTNNECLLRALRRIRAYDPATTLSTTEQTNGLSVLGSVLGEVTPSWFDVVGEEGYVAGEDERVQIDSAVTIYTPTFVYFNGDAVDPSDSFDETTMRLPRPGAKIQVVRSDNNTVTTYIYREDLALWADITTTANDPLPYGPEVEDLICSALAVRLADEYGEETSPAVQRQALQWETVKRLRGQANKQNEYEFF